MLLSFKRALRVLAAISGWITFDFGLLLLLSLAENYDMDSLEDILGISLLILNFLVIPGLLIYLRHNRREQWIKDEAERWLKGRAEQGTGSTKRWPRRLLRSLLLVPSVMALTVFFFEPQSFGVLSQVFHGRTAMLKGHPLHIPATAIITNSDDRSLNLALAKGIARVGLSDYFRTGLRLTSASFYVEDRPYYGDRSFIDQYHPADREFAFGEQTLDCRSTDQRPPFDRDRDTNVSCVTSNRDFVAYFGGPASDLSIFLKS